MNSDETMYWHCYRSQCRQYPFKNMSGPTLASMAENSKIQRFKKNLIDVMDESGGARAPAEKSISKITTTENKEGFVAGQRRAPAFRWAWKTSPSMMPNLTFSLVRLRRALCPRRPCLPSESRDLLTHQIYISNYRPSHHVSVSDCSPHLFF